MVAAGYWAVIIILPPDLIADPAPDPIPEPEIVLVSPELKGS